MTLARGVGIRRFGGPEVLEVVERDVPEPGPGEVRVRVAGAAISHVDLLFRAGVTSAGIGDLQPPWVPGMDLAGVVESVGEGARHQVGDRVMAMTTPFRFHGGAQSELVVVPADSLAGVPDELDLLAASTLPMNGLTARMALDHLALRPGQVLAVTGAAGVVGGWAVELAKEAGLRVVADAADDDRAAVTSFGADVIVPRGEGFAEAVRSEVPGGVDGLLDAATIGDAVVGALAEGGAIAAVRPLSYPSAGERTVHVVFVRDYMTNNEALAGLGTMAARGGLTLRLLGTVTPSDVGLAHDRIAAGGLRGRIVVSFDRPTSFN